MKNPMFKGAVIALMAMGTMTMAAETTQIITSTTPVKKAATAKTSKTKTGARTLKAAPAKTSALVAKATLKTAAATKPAAKTPAKTSIAKTATTTATATTTQTSAAALAAPAMTPDSPMVVRTPITTVKAQTKKSPWGFKYKSYNALNLNAALGQNSPGGAPDGEVRAWDRFYLTYDINSDISVFLMPQLYHTWFGDRSRPQDPSIPGLKQPYAAYVGDTALYVADSKIAKLQGDITFGGYEAYFAPTSEASQAAGQIGESRTELNLSKSFGNWDFKWTEQFRYYIQQYETSSLDKKGAPIQNLQARLWNLLDIGWNITKKLSLGLEVGTMNQRKFADTNNGTPAALTDFNIFNPSISYAFNDNFAIDAGYWEMFAATGNSTNQPWQPMNPDNIDNGDSELFLMTTIKF